MLAPLVLLALTIAAEPEVGGKPRDEVREIAKPLCGECHQGSRPTAKPAALAIFDLDVREWQSSLTVQQLRGFWQRIQGKLDAATRPRVRAFLDAQLALRKP